MAGPFPYQLGAIVRSTGTQIDFGRIAPVCEVTVSYAGNLEVIPALFDTGSSRTVIPHRLTRELNLRKMNDTVEVLFANGKSEQRSLYVTGLQFLGLNFPRHSVITLEDREHILIGRDIMNRYRITLDGLPHQFYIE